MLSNGIPSLSLSHVTPMYTKAVGLCFCFLPRETATNVNEDLSD